MGYEIVKVYATFADPAGMYKDIYTDENEAKDTGLLVVGGWIIIDANGYVAEDTNDIYFDYSEAMNDLVGLEAEHEEEGEDE